jgi:hypothetical protein
MTAFIIRLLDKIIGICLTLLSQTHNVAKNVLMAGGNGIENNMEIMRG